MKIISNDEVYIQGNDLERLLHNDKTFPIDMFYAITKGMSHVKSLTKFIRVEEQKIKEHIKSSVIIPDFGELYSCTIEELERKIKELKKEEWDIECQEETLGRPQTAEEKIEIYRTKKNIDYLLSQIREVIAFKKGKTMLRYPNIPNPGHRVFAIGELRATLSLQDNKIICYPVKGRTLDDIPSLAFEVAIDDLKYDMRDYSEEVKFNIERTRTEDNKYEITTFDPQDELKNKNEISRRLKNVKKNS